MESELEQKIRKIIEEEYGCETTFKIRAQVIQDFVWDWVQEKEVVANTTYMLYLYLHNQQIDPVHIIYLCDTEEEFLDFLRKDLQKRDLIRSKHFKIELSHDIEI